MGVFDLFKKKPKFTDDVFGELESTKMKGPSNHFYYGDVKFLGKHIGIHLTADEKGPTDAQKAFFKTLIHDYSDIKDQIILPFLKLELETYVIESGLNNFEQSFDMEGISIDGLEHGIRAWSISYYSIPMRHTVTIDFHDMKPICMTIDG